MNCTSNSQPSRALLRGSTGNCQTGKPSGGSTEAAMFQVCHVLWGGGWRWVRCWEYFFWGASQALNWLVSCRCLLGVGVVGEMIEKLEKIKTSESGGFPLFHLGMVFLWLYPWHTLIVVGFWPEENLEAAEKRSIFHRCRSADVFLKPLSHLLASNGWQKKKTHPINSQWEVENASIPITMNHDIWQKKLMMLIPRKRNALDVALDFKLGDGSYDKFCWANYWPLTDGWNSCVCIYIYMYTVTV